MGVCGTLSDLDERRRTAPQRQHELRQVFDALRWMVRSGSPWRYLPNDFPRWDVVYQQTQRWLKAGCFEAMVEDLRMVLRVFDKRKPTPSAAIYDKGNFIMRIFVTGATGFIGSAIVQELLGAGHQVLGLARSDKSANSLATAGAEVHRGSLEDLDSLRSGAAASDGVIHTAFIHDFANVSLAEASEVDGQAVEALASALEGTSKPLVIASGTAQAARGHTIITEQDVSVPATGRSLMEERVIAATRGVRSSAVRLPP